jgi:ankyrin repeat protein
MVFEDLMPLKDFNTASALAECSATPRQAFFGAIRAGNLALVLDILKQEPKAVHWQEIRDDVGVFDAYGLHLAAQEGKLEIAKALIDAGAFVNARDSNGRSPLVAAIEHGKAALVEYLVVEAKADPNQANGADVRPLMKAAAENDTTSLALLLQSGAKLEARKNGENALFYAVQGNAEAAIEFLIAQGIRADIRNMEGNDARTEAMELNRPQLAKLIDAGVTERERLLEEQAQAARDRDIAAMAQGAKQPVAILKPFRLKAGP